MQCKKEKKVRDFRNWYWIGLFSFLTPQVFAQPSSSSDTSFTAIENKPTSTSTTPTSPPLSSSVPQAAPIPAPVASQASKSTKSKNVRTSKAPNKITPPGPVLLENKVSIEEKNGFLIVKEECPECYPRGVWGMRDTPSENQERSVKTGSAAQYVLAGPLLDKAQIDKIALAQEINDFIKVSGEYFKTKPDYKGAFVSVFAYYPGYTKPYQAAIPPKINDTNMRQLQSLNRALSQESQCNRDKFCSLFAVVAANYQNPSNPQQKVDKSDFGRFMQRTTTNQGVHIYHKNKELKDPVMIVLYQGINGYLINKDFVREDLQRMSQDFKDLKNAQALLESK